MKNNSRPIMISFSDLPLAVDDDCDTASYLVLEIKR